MKKYLYLVKKKLLLIASILLLMLPSCSEDVLEEIPLDFLAPENAYNTLPGIRQGISGLHTRVRTWWYYGQDDAPTQMYGVGTDVAFFGEPSSTRWLCDYLVFLRPDNPYTSWWWTWNYQLIQMANALIEGINASDATIWESEGQRNAYLAEAMFFRAYAYRILVSFYGDVPLVTEVIKSAKTDFVRAPKADVYKLMEEDLIFATEHLPLPRQEEAPGRITVGAAWHMLSELYLTEGKYQLAVDAASQVIDGYSYGLMTNRFGTRLGKDILGSGDVYFDLFGYGNHNLAENTEAIWVIQVEPLVTGGAGNIGERAFGPAYFRMGNTPDGFAAIRGELFNGSYTGYSDTLGRPVGWFRPTNYTAYEIWMSDWNNDIRNAKHNIKREFYFDNPESAYHKQKIDFSLYPPGARDAIRDTCEYIYPYWMKFADPLNHFTRLDLSGAGTNHKDIYAIRLAETLLLRAEGYLYLGNKDLAAADVNAIRNRANATPVLAADLDLDDILDERARELFGEEFRPITLRRMGKLVERTRLYNNNPVVPGANIQDYNDLYPIPQSQIDLNINAVMKQNPGYPQ